MKKILAFTFTIFILVFIATFTNTLEVDAAVKMNKKTKLDGISTSVRTKKHLSGSPISSTTAVNWDSDVKGASAYCFAKSKTSPSEGQSASSKKDTIKSGKRLCALYTGLPSGDGGTKKFLETQIALWMIQEGKTDISISYMPTKSKYIPEAKKIYNKCKNEGSFKIKPSISISSISVPTKATNGKYVATVKVSKSHVTSYKISSVSISGTTYSKSALTGNSFTISIPESKITSSTSLKVEVTATGPEYYINVYNFSSKQPMGVLLKHNITDTASKSTTVSPTYYTASIKKVDAEDGNKVLSGATFALYKGTGCSGTAVKTVVTGSSGIAKFTNLLTGTYSVKETKAPTGYTLNNTCKKATLDGTVTLKNSKQSYTASVKKVDSNDDTIVLANAKFGLYDDPSCSSDAIDEKTTDTTGIAKFENLSDEDYYIKELEAPDGYDLNDVCTKATLNSTITLKDEKEKLKLSVKKVDADNEEVSLPNAKFGLYTDSNCTEEVGEPQSTDITGIAKFENLSNQDYYIKELEAPDGYDINDACTLAKINTTVTVKDNKKYGVEILKVDEKDPDSYLKDAEFSLYATGDCTGDVVKTAVTDGTGIASFPNLDMATYSIKETKAPEGYKASDECFDRDDGKTITASNAKYMSLAVKKVDSVNDGLVLSGAEFSLYNGEECEGEPINKGTTGANGLITFTNLTEGKYSVKETKAPEGYNLNEQCYSGEVEDTIIVENEKYQSISVKKADEDDETKLLAGAIFKLYDNLGCEGEAIKTAETNINGIATFDQLTVGEYSVKEEKAPAGFYDLLDINQSCKGVELSGITTFNYTNKKVKCEFYNDEYYNDEGKVVTEEEYNEKCNPKCEIKDDKYYDSTGKTVTEDEYNDDCNPKCQMVGDVYYNNSGKPVNYDTYKKECGLMCILKDGKYYNKDYEEVDEAGYKKSCNPNCDMQDDKYYDDDGNEIDEDEYNEKCNPKCGIRDDKYYNDSGKEIDYNTYKKVCFPSCGIRDDKYYDDNNNEVTESEYNKACNPKCTYENGTYYNKNGNPVSEKEYNKECNPKCETKDGKYYNLNGEEINLVDFYKECNPKCNIVNNIYYNSNGKPVSRDVYNKECNPKCEIAGGKYYNSAGEVVSQQEYNRICNPKCKIENGNYYDSNGKSVSESDYNSDCNPKCTIKNNVYYGQKGNIVSKSTYKNECTEKIVAAPDTGSPLKIILTILGILLIFVPIGMVYKDKIKEFLASQLANRK